MLHLIIKIALFVNRINLIVKRKSTILIMKLQNDNGETLNAKSLGDKWWHKTSHPGKA